IDRMGKPGFNTLLINTDDKQKYNKAPTWAAPPAFVLPEFDGHLKFLDKIDGKQDWGPADGGTHQLAIPLGGADPGRDILVVDPRVACADKGSYLDIELYLLGFYAPGDGGPSAPYTSCGGRTPNDDVIDHSLSALVLGPAGVHWTTNTGGAATDPIGDCVGA